MEAFIQASGVLDLEHVEEVSEVKVLAMTETVTTERAAETQPMTTVTDAVLESNESEKAILVPVWWIATGGVALAGAAFGLGKMSKR